MPKKILLHTCCAPCTTAVVEKLRKSDYAVSGFFYNPNIHPYQEFQKRRETIEIFSSLEDFTFFTDVDYPLEDFLKQSLEQKNRCFYCYQRRLKRTAQEAKEREFHFFSTTLLISPYQDIEALRFAGEEVGQEFGIKFYFEDFRPLYKKSREMAKAKNLYQQKYCGCIFSERDRFQKS